MAHQDAEQRTHLQQKLETELTQARYSHDQLTKDNASLLHDNNTLTEKLSQLKLQSVEGTDAVTRLQSELQTARTAASELVTVRDQLTSTARGLEVAKAQENKLVFELQEA
jgi:hypothetical protein